MFISNESRHVAIFVYTLIGKLVPLLKEVVPNFEMLYYCTDSPTSQYRNRTIFQIISRQNILASRPHGFLWRLAVGKVRVIPSEAWLNERLIKPLKMGNMLYKTP